MTLKTEDVKWGARVRIWLELIEEEPQKGDLYRVKRDAELGEVYLGPERYLLGKTVTFTGEYIPTTRGRFPYFDCPRKSGDGTERFYLKWDMVEKVEKEKEMSELEEYKKKVYEVAKRIKSEQPTWCNPGYREVLNELGLTDPAVATLNALPDGAVLTCGGEDVVVKSGKKWIYHSVGAEPETLESTENLVTDCDGSDWLIVATNESIKW